MVRRLSVIPWRLPGLLIFFILFLGGCAMTSEYKVPQMNLPQVLPDGKESGIEEPEIKYGLDHQQWWTRFEDPDLDFLVDRALRDNPDIRLQAARVQGARARLGFARADQFPTVGIQADAVRERQPSAAISIPGVGGSTGNLFSIAGVLNYEIDIWGRVAREREAAEALLQQSVFAREAVRLSVISDVATTYFSLSAARNELVILRETLESRQKTYELEKIRFEAGETGELILRQAESELEAVRARIPGQVRQVRLFEGVLGILVGLSPAELFADFSMGTTAIEEIQNPEVLPAILPSELLTRRPDIRAAEAGLSAAGANIGIAHANRLPRLNLATFLGTVATETGDLFTASARTWGIGATAAGPLLDFGRNRASVESAEAIYFQSEIEYETTVKVAFNEVRDALVFYESAVDHEQAVRRQFTAAQRTLNLAEHRYREGLVGFIDFLDAQRAHLTARQAMNNAVRDRLSATATLYKALGGGWHAEAVEEAVQNNGLG